MTLKKSHQKSTSSRLVILYKSYEDKICISVLLHNQWGSSKTDFLLKISQLIAYVGCLEKFQAINSSVFANWQVIAWLAGAASGAHRASSSHVHFHFFLSANAGNCFPFLCKKNMIPLRHFQRLIFSHRFWTLSGMVSNQSSGRILFSSATAMDLSRLHHPAAWKSAKASDSMSWISHAA